jgi:hypothetical protein
VQICELKILEKSELLKKELSANLRAKNPRKELASEEISVEMDELIPEKSFSSHTRAGS